MKTESYRELQVLDALSSNPRLTQRHLAQKLEVALGLTNLMIRRFINKGHVKVVNLQKNRIQYLLTPKGIAEKTRLTYEYLEYSLYLYRRVREVLQESLGRLVQSGGRRVLLFGTEEIAEVVYLTIKEVGMELIGIVDEKATGSRFLGMPALSPEALGSLSYDYGIISTLSNDLEGLRERLSTLGVPEEKMILLEQQGLQIRAVLPETNLVNSGG